MRPPESCEVTVDPLFPLGGAEGRYHRVWVSGMPSLGRRAVAESQANGPMWWVLLTS